MLANDTADEGYEEETGGVGPSGHAHSDADFADSDADDEHASEEHAP